ncbi:uncharacterized protein N7529_002303 [Penicillium soppii]|uniref:uncharacterized protein n=1 Tax=Penicillium soppii TaxID=69789 RepID=UPI0025479DF9|nr:uncharacterized protein N7529_002303 [Penicillium soppii]KAJ5873873.1 hypothetical protein N7529_002303 [Penicillium soppii]
MFNRNPRLALRMSRLLSAPIPRSPALRIKTMASSAPKYGLEASINERGICTHKRLMSLDKSGCPARYLQMAKGN